MPSPAELELRNSPEMRAMMLEAAAEVASIARRFEADAKAPWLPPKGNRGTTITVETDGADVIVANLDHAGHLIEWGSRNNPPHAPLRRAVRAAGLTFAELPK